MTKMDVIKLIGDLLTEIDVLRGSLPSALPKTRRLDALRERLDAQQREFVKLVFDEGTAQYKDITNQLKTLNDEARQMLRDLQRVIETLGTLTKFVEALDDLLMLAVGIVA